MPSPLRLALGGAAAFVALVAVQHPLRPGLPAHEHFISEYAIGSTSALQVLAFLLWGLSFAATAVLSRGLRVVTTGLGVAALGTALCAAFATQTVAGVLPPGVERTTGGRLHDVGSLLILVGLLGAMLAGLRPLRTRRYRRGVLACAVGLVLAPGVLVAAGLDWPGIGQRAIVLVGVGAGLLLATELATRDRRTRAPARA